MSSDPLRTTLDALALDPDAGSDRHYLVTVLRRLGYSEEEIRRVVGDEGEEGRVIEVEYTGSGPDTFAFGVPGTEEQAAAAIKSGQGSLQFTLAGDDKPMQFKLAGDDAAGVETLEGVELGEGDISDDWGDDWGEGGDFSIDGDVQEASVSEEGDLFAQPDDDGVDFREVDLVEFKEREPDLVGFSLEGDDDPAESAGWTEVDDDAWGPVDEAPGGVWEPVDEATGAAGAEEVWEPAEEPWPEQTSQAADEPTWEAEETWGEPEELEEVTFESRPAEEAPFTYDDYTLYTRPVELTTGKTQDIYFFAKNEPKSGHPSPMPEGYEVGVSEKTSLPFLRKSDRQVQCGALTADGDQCRLTAQSGSHYCHVHKDYEPPTAEEMSHSMDTDPFDDVADTWPGEKADGPHQCAAVTQAGKQCRNTARDGSKYCMSHKGYHPRRPERSLDTEPVGKGVKDTLPSVQKGNQRLRMRHVDAASREEAERLVAREGGRVRGVVPVRVEQHDEEEA